MRTALFVLAVLLAGCLGSTSPLPQPTGPDDGLIAVRGTVVDPLEVPVPGASLQLHRPDGRHYETTSGSDGRFVVLAPVLESCHLDVQKAGFQATRFDLSCQDDVDLLLRLSPRLAAATGSERPPVAPAPQGPFPVTGRVLDAATGLALPGASIRHGPPGQADATLRADATGGYALTLAKGDHEFVVTRPCYSELVARARVEGPMEFNFLLSRPARQAPTAPANARALPGPGHGQITIAWDASPGADCGAVFQHQIYRGTSPSNLQPLLRIGNSQAYADSGRATGTTYHYQVAAVDRYGVEGPRSPVVSSTPKIIGVAPTPVNLRSLNLKVEEQAYPVLDVEGTVVGERTWRVVQNLGNCCENYFAVASDGALYDFGGTFLRVSRDEGRTWQEVTTPVPYATGEGAITGAPNGDVVGIGWSPYGGDQLWAHKYVAADKQWYYEPIPAHGPFYDRPWIGVIKGPFERNGEIVPYLTFARSGFGVNGYTQIVSFDGIHYEDYHVLAAEGGLATSLPWPETLAPDPDRDWSQPQRETRITPVGNGLGLYHQGQGTCNPWYTPDRSMQWRCAKPLGLTAADFPMVDSDGRLVGVRAGSELRVSEDLGRTWTTTKVPKPEGWSVQEWDYKVNGELGIAAIAILWQTDRSGTPDEVRAYKYDVSVAPPRLLETLVVGKGDKNLGGGLASTLPRFDFMTMGIRPGGKLMVSFGDSAHASPQTAIEL